MQEKKLHWWLIRHAPILSIDESGHSTAGKFIGQLDIGCESFYPQTLKWLIHALPNKALLIDSGLKRSKQTAETLTDAGLTYAAYEENPAFAEQNFGDWQGMDYDEHYQKYRTYWDNVIDNKPPDGESFSDLCTRVNKAMMNYYYGANLYQHGVSQHIIVIGHSGSIRAMIASTLNETMESALSYELAPFSLSHFIMSQKEGNLIVEKAGINQIADDSTLS